MTTPPLHYYILSDSLGETALKVAKASFAQFPDIVPVLHKHPFIANEDDLHLILEEALKYDGLLFMTIVDSHLAKYVEKFCIETGLICYNLIQPFTLEIARRLGKEPTEIPGVQYELSDEYFDRIRAMEFTLAYDDGKDPKALHEAEIVLLGISRTGKTPLSMYLGTQGYKVVNLPLIPEKEITPILFEIDPKKIVGLTNSLDVITTHRKERAKEFRMSSDSFYCSSNRINEELAYAKEIYSKLGCLVLNVSARSFEESASIIIQKLHLPQRT